MKSLIVSLLILTAGCSGPVFRNVGNGVGVSQRDIDRYAKKHGVTSAEAAHYMAMESQMRQIEDHAAKYGVTEEEARQQLNHAARQTKASKSEYQR